ncbi:MAG: transposase [Luteimonas sp.]|nr:transposase [Luteimonas sp.]
MDRRVINGKDTRRKHSETLKRDLVERSLRTGASVSALAQEHGINANLLFNWRRLHLRAQNLDTVVVAPAPGPTLLPVTVRPEMQSPAAQPQQPPLAPARASTGTIEIEIGNARVRLRGTVDDASLRSVLRALSELA